ncbi:hypothetical protein HanRHA438_Chr15g0731071 [Helianthus annuus]|uniref:Uncharacterized protein n=1 Tax=Helianthus annuus TaxID=4232 RepID=A0A251SCD7_HELAN|nr:hypothetical protein HanXRQr2_Chr15g0718761 [Helianthus annuus]KAJ0453068.1 hypothetical protein HanHA300_Chr15g0586191 [Helianthus annuus]KAJ0474978.1 hypothetical protein HanHA89_Chr15g0635931 [Helianthus annuus]KAJ0650533.1 hypothetical protein HanLR1_Chr15g0596841 [Helianthus annuus]KAJ0654286.1 hypothetical protein HanOQP8_Chr15g0593261 [Helianthus annuus]
MRFTFGSVSIHLKFVRFDRFGFNSKRVRSTKVNSGQAANCRANWSNIRSGMSQLYASDSRSWNGTTETR